MEEYEVGLFAHGPEGVAKFLGRSRDPELVEIVRAHLAGEQRRALVELESPCQLVPNQETENRPAKDEPQV